MTPLWRSRPSSHVQVSSAGRLGAGDTISLGGASVLVLWPNRTVGAGTGSDNERVSANDEVNDTSMVLEIRYGERRILLTGDITEKVDAGILDEDAEPAGAEEAAPPPVTGSAALRALPRRRAEGGAPRQQDEHEPGLSRLGQAAHRRDQRRCRKPLWAPGRADAGPSPRRRRPGPAHGSRRLDQHLDRRPGPPRGDRAGRRMDPRAKRRTPDRASQ